jgi:DNA repair exonuclease SbcCD ATPase subunit
VLLPLLALLSYADADPSGYVVRTLDEGVGPEVRPLDVDELVQISQEPAGTNTPEQATLAAEASKTHATKLEMEKSAQGAEAKFKAAETQAQEATARALDTASPDDADAAVTMKSNAASAKEQHAKAVTDYSAAQQNADDALKKARDAGAIVNLPQPTPLPPAVVPAPPAAGAPPPLQPPPVEPSSLDTILKDRRLARLKKEAHDLHKKYEEAKVEKEQTDYDLTKAEAALTKVKTKMAESKSAKEAAEKEQGETDKKIQAGHLAEHLAEKELKDAKHEAKLSESMVDEAHVEEEVASSLADTGGGEEDMEASEEKREEVNERLKKAKAEVVTMKMAAESTKAAAEAAEAALLKKKDELEALHRVLAKADSRYAEAKYEIERTESDEMVAEENRDQAKAEDENAAKAFTVSHGLANAATLKLTSGANADEAQMKAFLMDPEEAEKEAIARIKDQDGLSEEGEKLVADDGSIEQDYVQKYDQMPLPDNGNNPILEAEARAQLKDDQENEATQVAAAPGVAETAAAAATGVMPTK